MFNQKEYKIWRKIKLMNDKFNKFNLEDLNKGDFLKGTLFATAVFLALTFALAIFG